MDFELQKIIELCREPMMVLENKTICKMNLPAQALFPDLQLGCSAIGTIPEHILSDPAESFFSSIAINGKQHAVSALRNASMLLLSFSAAPSPAELRGCLSDSQMSRMMSALFNINLSAERVFSGMEPSVFQNPDTQKYYSAFMHNYFILKHRLSSLNTFFSLAENSMMIIPRHTDLVALCRDITASTNIFVKESFPEIEFVCTLETLPAQLDAPKVELLILNLLSNALKNTPKGGFIRLGLAKSGENAVISVDDSGSGIPPEKLQHIFLYSDRHMDENNLSDAGGGIGLGLCHSIAEKHGGSLILESRRGMGTSVRVLLPLTMPGSAIFRNELPPYENGGMGILFSELCDVLDMQAYKPKFSD